MRPGERSVSVERATKCVTDPKNRGWFLVWRPRPTPRQPSVGPHPAQSHSRPLSAFVGREGWSVENRRLLTAKNWRNPAYS
jgi:hypothetical protein